MAETGEKARKMGKLPRLLVKRQKKLKSLLNQQYM